MQIRIFLFLLLCSTIGIVNAQEILCVESQNNDVLLSWSPPAAPCGPFVSYEIWVANALGGTFTQVTTVNIAAQTTYTHVNAFNIGDPLYYYIIYNYNCPGTAPVISEIATNAFGSFQPEISSLNVLPNGIEVCWEESEFIQTCGYVVAYLLPNGLAQPFDTVFGITNTCYLDQVSNINDPDLVYTLTYLDCCDNLSQYNDIGYQLIQATSDQQGCNQLIEYEWQPYNNPYSLDFEYHISVQVNGGPIEVVDTLANNQTIFNFLDFIDQDEVRFRVEIVDENGMSRSNGPWLMDTAEIVQPPRDFFIRTLSVTNPNQIDITFYIDTISELRNLEIDTSKYGVDFDWVARYGSNLFPGLGDLYLPDTTSPAYNAARYYQIAANDSCGTDHFSTIGRTIYVDAELYDFFQNKVFWNAFELENAAVNTYRLFRDYGAGLQLIETFPGGASEFEYIDDISAFANQQGTFCYKVEAEYTFTPPIGLVESLSSSSNVNCIEQRPSVYIPNAIAPNGINNEFKPLIVFGDPRNYSMQIFNRWGELIFKGNDPNSGWFGTNNGSPVPTGGYPYVIQFTASDGANIVKKGIVTVIR
jgi:gliding motility-associated-like protein